MLIRYRLHSVLNHYILLAFMMIMMTTSLFAQRTPVFTQLPSLPGNIGWAGMFAGVSDGNLFCMGGANFPDKMPWEGGKKKWYNDIYMLGKDEKWIRIKEQLPYPAAYGVSVTYKNEIIVIGGSGETLHYNAVLGLSWNGQKMNIRKYPDLPVALANMAGTVVGDIIIIAGGNQAPAAKGETLCYTLDLKDLNQQWIALPSWPGRERILPVCGSWRGLFYLFSGETTFDYDNPLSGRYILEDAYCFKPKKTSASWSGSWEKLPDMPRGTSAAASPVPVIDDIGFVFWGGVDAVTALHNDPTSHPGISKDIFSYSPERGSWHFLQKVNDIPARVTLPVVNWNGKWVYVSGETGPGVRTTSLYSIR